MYTQFHVETSAGRLLCHRLAEDAGAGIVQGSRVALTWEAEHASVLAAAPPLPARS
jgi:hypothetical protein